jgi:hypothetical protein
MFLNLRLSTLSLFHPHFEKNCVSDFCLINSLIQLLHVVDCSFSFCYQYRVIIIKRFQFFLQNTALSFISVFYNGECNLCCRCKKLHVCEYYILLTLVKLHIFHIWEQVIEGFSTIKYLFLSF